MESQQLHKLFEEREKVIKEEILKEAEKIAEREMKLFEFELFYSLVLENKETTGWVQEKRKNDWEKALREAKGDVREAMSIFAS
ncbi:hypothetical protein HZC30_08095 [Candidatus Woesearchaeota archaeon]|nr:hypothetical protein [Candidatus Woesearchaeota archaeon]